MISKDCGFLSSSCCVHCAIWLHFGHSGLYPMFVWSQNLAMVSDIICLQLIFIYLTDELKATNSTVPYGKKEELTYKYNKHNFTHLFSLMHCKSRSSDFSSIVMTVYLIYINEPEWNFHRHLYLEVGMFYITKIHKELIPPFQIAPSIHHKKEITNWIKYFLPWKYVEKKFEPKSVC